MRFSTAGTLAALAATASAFADTAPFAIFASEDVSSSFRGFGNLKKPIVPAAELPTFNCPKVEHILILTHPGVNVADFASPSTFLPLKRAIASAPYSLQVPEITGEYDQDALYEKLQKECGYEALKLRDGDGYMSGKEALDLQFTAPEKGVKSVLRTELNSLDSWDGRDMSEKGVKEREFSIAQDDTKLLNLLPNYAGKSYMVIYIGSPSTTPQSAKMNTPAPLDDSDRSRPCANGHGELERPHLSDSFRIQARSEAPSEKNSTASDHRPLFEKYQFFTPGLFMGLLVTLMLLSILFVALRAISSLEVSYAAFEKEMGPQKKAQ